MSVILRPRKRQTAGLRPMRKTGPNQPITKVSHEGLFWSGLRSRVAGRPASRRVGASLLDHYRRRRDMRKLFRSPKRRARQRRARHIEGGSSGDQGAGLRSRTLRMREQGGGLTSYFCPGGWVYSEPPPVGQSRYRSLQCRRRSRPPASGISYCRPPLDWLLFSDRFSSATKRAASPQRQNQCHDASREARCSAN
jgi:hypothetical protein